MERTAGWNSARISPHRRRIYPNVSNIAAPSLRAIAYKNALRPTDLFAWLQFLQVLWGSWVIFPVVGRDSSFLLISGFIVFRKKKEYVHFSRIWSPPHYFPHYRLMCKISIAR